CHVGSRRAHEQLPALLRRAPSGPGVRSRCPLDRGGSGAVELPVRRRPEREVSNGAGLGPTLLSSLVSIALGGVVNNVLGQLGQWVSLGASGILAGLGAAMNATTAAPLNEEFIAVYAL